MNPLIQHIKITQSLSDNKTSLISDKLVEKHFSKKKHLVYFEDYAKELFFTAKGCVRTYVTDFIFPIVIGRRT